MDLFTTNMRQDDGTESAKESRNASHGGSTQMNDLAWGRLTSAEFWLTEARLLGTVAATAGVKLVGIFLLYLLARRLLARGVDRLLPPLLGRVRPAAQVRESRVQTIGGLLKSIGQYLLVFITA